MGRTGSRCAPRVVGGQQWDGARLRVADPADDHGEDVGEFGADQQDTLLVGLGRGTDTVVALGDKPPGRTGNRAESYEQLAKDLRRW